MIFTQMAAAHQMDDSGLDFAPKIISGGVTDRFGKDDGAREEKTKKYKMENEK